MKRGWIIGRMILAAMLLVVMAACLGGCASATAGGKMVNWQNKLAGDFIAATATDPVIQQAGADVSQNALVVADQIGMPEVPDAEYTAARAAELRERAMAEKAQQRQIAAAGKGLLDTHAPWAVAVISLLGNIGLAVVKRTSDLKVTSCIKTIDQIKKVASTDGISPGEKAIDVVNTIAKNAQAFYNVGKEIAADISKLKATGTIG